MPAYKPAVYFYPPCTREMFLKLDPTIKMTLDMPKYNPKNGWHFLAHPEGTITDLQPELTNCNDIDTDKPGLEYALKACRTNNYPYIYWEGHSMFKPVPKSLKGWAVNKNELAEFLDTKLSYIGFNQNEKRDFMEYWLQKLTKLKQDKFFIYFIQNETVEDYLPVKITPAPDHINRLYMVVKPDYIPLEGKIAPQKLKKFIRKDFYIVDWGGILKQ